MDWLYVLMPIAGIKIFWPGLIILGCRRRHYRWFFRHGRRLDGDPGSEHSGLPHGLCHRHRHRPHGRQVSHLHHAPRQIRQRRLQIGPHHAGVARSWALKSAPRWSCVWNASAVVELYVRLLYLVLLSLIAWMVFADVAKKKRKEREALAAGKEMDKLATGIEWHKTLHKIKIPPMVHFKDGADLLHRLAAHLGELLHRLAGGHPGHRRRSDPHAGPDLLRGLPHARGGGHRPLRGDDLRAVRRGALTPIKAGPSWWRP